MYKNLPILKLLFNYFLFEQSWEGEQKSVTFFK